MSEAARLARQPSSGWIGPSLDDKIINDARDGLTLAAICFRNLCTEERAIDVIVRGGEFGFLTAEEILSTGAEEAANA